MKIVIEVGDRHEDELRAFKEALAKRGRPTKGIPSLTLSVLRGTQVSDITLHRFVSVEVEGLPEIKIEPGDVVRVKDSGHWGRVLSVGTKGKLNIKASRVTRAETDCATFSCQADEVEILV